MIRLKKVLPVIVVLSLIIFLTHCFIYIAATRSIENDENFNRAFAVTLILGGVAIPLGLTISLSSYKKKLALITWVGFIWMGLFNFLFFSSLIEFFLALFFNHAYSFWTLIFSFLIGLWALTKGLKKPSVIIHEIKGPEFLKGLSLVQVSDLHVGLLHLNASWLNSVVETINSLKADFVAITGDLVEGPFAEVSPQLVCLKNIKSRIESFYVTGNHEYIHGSGPWEKTLQSMNFKILHNDHQIFKFENSKLLIAGVPDRMVKRFNSALVSSPDTALASKEKVDYKILLAHEPASVWDLKKESCDLILSGHTHGGQIFPFGLFVRLVQPVVKGFKQFGPVLVFAHQGTGFWGPPMRWFSRSEIVLFKWV
jgi:uncharacterized protein